jgi:hypothetical protein
MYYSFGTPWPPAAAFQVQSRTDGAAAIDNDELNELMIMRAI